MTNDLSIAESLSDNANVCRQFPRSSLSFHRESTFQDTMDKVVDWLKENKFQEESKEVTRA
jgi:hypothetical protein